MELYLQRVTSECPALEEYAHYKFEDIPIMNKGSYKLNFEKYINKNVSKELLIGEYTTGTTGEPLLCLKNQNELLRSQVLMWKWRKTFLKGYMETGKLLILSNGESKDTTHYFGNLNCVVITPQELEYGSISTLVDVLEEVVWIRGTPSLVLYLMKRLQKVSYVSKRNIKFIEVTGENILNFQKKELASYFGCFVGNQYGAREIWPIACECSEGNLHIIEDHVFCELTNEDRYDGEYGELVITSINQTSFPFIRYNLGDVVRLESISCTCGQSGLIISDLQGRDLDFFYYKENKYSSHMFAQSVKEYNTLVNEKISKFFVYYDNVDKFLFQYEGVGLTSKEAEWLVDNLEKKLRSKIKLSIELIENRRRPLQEKNRYFAIKEDFTNG